MNIIEKIKGMSTAQKIGAGAGTAAVLGVALFLGYQAFSPQDEKPTATAKVVLNKTKEEVKKTEEDLKKTEEEKVQAEAEVKKVEEEKQALETALANETNEEKKEEIKKQIEEKAKVVETRKQTVQQVTARVEEKKQEVAKKVEEVKKAEVAVTTPSKPTEQPKQPEKPKDVITTKEVVENGATASIAYSTETRQDANLAKGQTRVEREGQNGQKVEKITYTVTYTNGNQTSKVEKGRAWETTAQPVNKIIVEGTKAAPKVKQPHANQAEAEKMAARINEIRASKGLPLARFTFNHSYAQKQAERGVLEHWQDLAGENLAKGVDSRAIVDDWMLDGHAMTINLEGNISYNVSVYTVYHGRANFVNWYILSVNR